MICIEINRVLFKWEMVKRNSYVRSLIFFLSFAPVPLLRSFIIWIFQFFTSLSVWWIRIHCANSLSYRDLMVGWRFAHARICEYTAPHRNNRCVSISISHSMPYFFPSYFSIWFFFYLLVWLYVDNMGQFSSIQFQFHLHCTQHLRLHARRWCGINWQNFLRFYKETLSVCVFCCCFFFCFRLIWIVEEKVKLPGRFSQRQKSNINSQLQSQRQLNVFHFLRCRLAIPYSFVFMRRQFRWCYWREIRIWIRLRNSNSHILGRRITITSILVGLLPISETHPFVFYL